MAKHPPYLFKKRGVYYFQKRVPSQLIPTIGKGVIIKSLSTMDKSLAVQTAGKLLKHLQKQWHEQLFDFDDKACIIKQLKGMSESTPLMTEAVSLYVAMKGKAGGQRTGDEAMQKTQQVGKNIALDIRH